MQWTLSSIEIMRKENTMKRINKVKNKVNNRKIMFLLLNTHIGGRN